MDPIIQQALTTDNVIDITTNGRKSGEPRRIEIWFHYLDGRVFITGSPGKRNWYANLVAAPHFTFHLKQSVKADLAATATPITDANQKRAILTPILAKLKRSHELADWVARSPLVAVQFA